MNAEVEDWGGGQFRLCLAVGSDEIDRLVTRLGVLRRDASQHFHISADGPGAGLLRDIEVSVLPRGQAHNMRISSVALAPGTEIPEPGVSRSGSRKTWVRSLLPWPFWGIGIVAGLEAAGDAYITFATNDYRPILIRGVWASAIAFVAFHFATLLAKGWKGRVSGIVGALVALYVLGRILPRLGMPN